MKIPRRVKAWAMGSSLETTDNRVSSFEEMRILISLGIWKGAGRT